MRIVYPATELTKAHTDEAAFVYLDAPSLMGRTCWRPSDLASAVSAIDVAFRYAMYDHHTNTLYCAPTGYWRDRVDGYVGYDLTRRLGNPRVIQAAHLFRKEAA